MKGLAAVLLPALVLAGCREITPVLPVDPTPDRTVILLNSSFELGGAATYVGWNTNNPSRSGFSSETPPDGGNWSASLNTTTGTPVRIETTLPATPGEHVYKLTVWAKRTVIDGSASILLKGETGSTVSSSVAADIVGWHPYTLFDTLFTQPGDSVIVRLSGGSSVQPTGSVLFDLCLFEQI